MKIDQAKIRYPEQSNKDQQNKVTRASIFTESFREEILNIPVRKLFPYSKQARQNFDEESLQNLAKTIKNHGIRQPLTVVDISGSGEKYEVVSGERRLRAARIVGLERIPCRVLQKQKDAVEIAIIENLQREDLHPIEVARSLKALLDEGVCHEQKEITDKVGLSKSSVSEFLSFLKIPMSMQNEIINKKITARERLRGIRDASTDEERLDLIKDSLVPVVPAQEKDIRERKSSKGGMRARKILSVSVENGNLRFDIKVASLSDEQKKQIFSRLEKALS